MIPAQAATDQIIKNLQRENAMITTAWYDLTSRLQSNHVVLQRRHDAPRSWLNKQRQMVNGESSCLFFYPRPSILFTQLLSTGSMPDAWFCLRVRVREC